MGHSKKGKSSFFKSKTKTPPVPKKFKQTQRTQFLLDAFSANDIEAWEARHQELYEYFWKEYSHYSHLRSTRSDALKNALLESCETFEFQNFYRCITFEYSSAPLSSAGSRISASGGRYNIGLISQDKFPSFAALYLGENEETAFREKFQVRADKNPIFDSGDFALRKKSSYSFLRVEGILDQVLDVTKSANLKSFLKQIRKIKVNEELEERAQQLGLKPPDSIRTMKKLMDALQDPDWASNPTLLDIPASSQIFGLIAKSAGIQGVLYSSKFATGKCLAIYPDNFQNIESYVRLSDPVPAGITVELNSKTFRQLS